MPFRTRFSSTSTPATRLAPGQEGQMSLPISLGVFPPVSSSSRTSAADSTRKIAKEALPPQWRVGSRASSEVHGVPHLLVATSRNSGERGRIAMQVQCPSSNRRIYLKPWQALAQAVLVKPSGLGSEFWKLNCLSPSCSKQPTHFIASNQGVVVIVVVVSDVDVVVSLVVVVEVPVVEVVVWVHVVVVSVLVLV
mmetsp:Transcript_39864/g.114256  ORF Transcript_39864/g.114256 Transcript_39864/m.114256 type:complete len:194 (+) Transcript_39864:397-978(+)